MVMVKRVGLLAALLLFAASASAELKVVVLNVQRAIGDTEEAKVLIKKLEDELAPEQNVIKQLNTDITAMQEKLRKDGDVMSEAERNKSQKALEDKQIDYQFRVNKLQKTVQDRQQEILGQMEPKFSAVLKDLITTEKYDMIIPRQGILYGDSKLDITAKVTELLNQKK